MSFLEVVKERTYVIAEGGCNHQGEVAIARDLIRAAKEAGADAIKFQMRDLALLYSDEELARPYTGPNSFGATYGDHRARLELSMDDHLELAEYAQQIGIDYSVSVWDPISADRAAGTLGVPWLKIPSAALTWDELLEDVSCYNTPVLLSTGMSDLSQVEHAYGLLGRLPQAYVWLLGCTSAYPCDFADVHLRTLETLREITPFVGMSGHWKGIAVDVAAVALGARVIERHFTLDRTWKGTDHAASLEPSGLEKLVRDIRAVEQALGSREKLVLNCEIGPMSKLRTAAMRSAA